MADETIASPPAAGTAGVGTDDCPHVADLINYALGHCLKDERRRVEAHLAKRECSACRSWVDRTASITKEGRPDLASREFSASLTGIPPAPRPSLDPTPIPASSQWQRRVFDDLEKRLRRLEET